MLVLRKDLSLEGLEEIVLVDNFHEGFDLPTIFIEDAVKGRHFLVTLLAEPVLDLLMWTLFLLRHWLYNCCLTSQSRWLGLNEFTNCRVKVQVGQLQKNQELVEARICHSLLNFNP